MRSSPTSAASGRRPTRWSPRSASLTWPSPTPTPTRCAGPASSRTDRKGSTDRVGLRRRPPPPLTVTGQHVDLAHPVAEIELVVTDHCRVRIAVRLGIVGDLLQAG